MRRGLGGRLRRRVREGREKAADEIFSEAKAAVWRDCSCCGDETSHEKSVKRLNDIAKDVMDDRGYPVARVFDLYGKKDLDDATVDGTHATPEYYHEWTMKIMAGVEAQLKRQAAKEKKMYGKMFG